MEAGTRIKVGFNEQRDGYFKTERDGNRFSIAGEGGPKVSQEAATAFRIFSKSLTPSVVSRTSSKRTGSVFSMFG